MHPPVYRNIPYIRYGIAKPYTYTLALHKYYKL